MTAADDQNLRALARAAAAGDRTAMAGFVRATSPVVWRICAALVDPGAADDLTQETYLRVVGALGRYRGDAPPIAWLIPIARRVCADEIDRRRRGRRLFEKLGRVDNAVPPAEPVTVAALNEALAQLTRPRLEAFLLTMVAGLSYAEAAAVCGCPVGTIRSRVSRARADLRLRMSGDDPGRRLTG